MNHKSNLITKPAIAVLISFGLPLLALLLMPNFLESGLSRLHLIVKSSQGINISSFPLFIYILVPLLFTLPVLRKLVVGIRTFNEWELGVSPACPECRGPMKIQIVKKGEFEGQRFWGCYKFSICRGKAHIKW